MTKNTRRPPRPQPLSEGTSKFVADSISERASIYLHHLATNLLLGGAGGTLSAAQIDCLLQGIANAVLQLESRLDTPIVQTLALNLLDTKEPQ